MQTVYGTIDGKVFNEISDAAKHEQAVLAQVKMWDWENDRTIDTSNARVVHLIGNGAGKMFKDMIASNPNDWQNAAVGDTIEDDDNGWFYWDEYNDTYRYIDSEIVDCLIAANHQI